jgi:uncharacterized membrane protein
MREKSRLSATNIYWALGIQALISIGFLFFSAIANHTTEHLFLIFNLFLAWIPLLVAVILKKYLKKKPWVSIPGAFLILVWICFLPNSFYIVSDLVHLNNFSSIDILVDIITFFMMAINGILVGLISVYLIHLELNKRIKSYSSILAILSIFLLCGLAIYLGRYLRWNSWDIILNPLSLLFDITNPIFDPETQTKAYTTTIGFFGLIGSCYLILWQSAKYLIRDEES